MAASVAALYERIYEILVDGSGVTRTLTEPQRFARLRTSKGDRTTIAVRAKIRPLVEVLSTEVEPDDGVADELHSEHHYMLGLVIRRWYYLGYEAAPAEIEATAVRMADDAMRVRAALSHPSNLLTTEEAANTGIGGPALKFVRSRLQRLEQLGDGRDRLVLYQDDFRAAFSFSPDG